MGIKVSIGCWQVLQYITLLMCIPDICMREDQPPADNNRSKDLKGLSHARGVMEEPFFLKPLLLKQYPVDCIHLAQFQPYKEPRDLESIAARHAKLTRLFEEGLTVLPLLIIELLQCRRLKCLLDSRCLVSVCN